MRSFSIALGIAVVVAIGCDGWEPPPPDVALSSTGSGEPLTQVERDCSAMCDRAFQLSCEDRSCTQRCVDAIERAGVCQAITSAYVGCLAREGLEKCTEVPAACEAAYDAFFGCANDGPCGPVQCVDPGSVDCKCEARCDGALYTESCLSSEDGFYQCACERDGEVVAECPQLGNACAFFIGCCAEVVAGG